MKQQEAIDQTLQANLERLSNLMAQKKENKPEPRQQFFSPTKTKKIFVNLRAFVKEPDPPMKQKRNIYGIQNAQSHTTTTQTQTPKTPTYRQQLLRPQSMALMEQFTKLQRDSKATLQSERVQEKSCYKNWVGLSVVDRNEQFLKKKQLKLQKMREEKDQDEISKCTFSPHFYNQIRIERPSSCMQNKSYQDIHKQRKNQNDKLY